MYKKSTTFKNTNLKKPQKVDIEVSTFDLLTSYNSGTNIFSNHTWMFVFASLAWVEKHASKGNWT